VLEHEHRAVVSIKNKADFIVTSSYEVTPA
jgi:hypothetical protein